VDVINHPLSEILGAPHAANAVVAYDRIIGLDMSEIAIDGSLFLLRAGTLIRPTTVVNRPRA
jgi:hypothetical protein